MDTKPPFDFSKPFVLVLNNRRLPARYLGSVNSYNINTEVLAVRDYYIELDEKIETTFRVPIHGIWDHNCYCEHLPEPPKYRITYQNYIFVSDGNQNYDFSSIEEAEARIKQKFRETNNKKSDYSIVEIKPVQRPKTSTP